MGYQDFKCPVTVFEFNSGETPVIDTNPEEQHWRRIGTGALGQDARSTASCSRANLQGSSFVHEIDSLHSIARGPRCSGLAACFLF